MWNKQRFVLKLVLRALIVYKDSCTIISSSLHWAISGGASWRLLQIASLQDIIKGMSHDWLCSFEEDTWVLLEWNQGIGLRLLPDLVHNWILSWTKNWSFLSDRSEEFCYLILFIDGLLSKNTIVIFVAKLVAILLEQIPCIVFRSLWLCTSCLVNHGLHSHATLAVFSARAAYVLKNCFRQLRWQALCVVEDTVPLRLIFETRWFSREKMVLILLHCLAEILVLNDAYTDLRGLHCF